MPKPELKDLFPLPSVDFKKTGKKISSDDASIMKKLIAKYNDDFKVRIFN